MHKDFWKTIWMDFRAERISFEFKLAKSVPLNSTTPSVGEISWLIKRATVDLPHPDSPTIPSVSPLYNSKLTPSTAFTNCVGF